MKMIMVIIIIKDYQQRSCQSLILAPTRELANQIQKVAIALGDYLKVRCHACIGGNSAPP